MAAIIALAASHAVSGDMYKCIGANGKVEYRDTACEGAAGVKITPKENTAGTGEGIESVRAKNAALNARQDMRRATADKEVADARAAQERAFQQERAHQDSVDRANAIREASSRRAADDYNSQYYRRLANMPVEIKPTPVKPKPPQSIPAYPIAQPAGLPVRRRDY